DPSRKIIKKITNQYKTYVEPLFQETSELEAQLKQHADAMLELQNRIGSTKQKVRTLQTSVEEMQKNSTVLQHQVYNLQSPRPEELELRSRVDDHETSLRAQEKRLKTISKSISLDAFQFHKKQTQNSRFPELSILKAQREKSNDQTPIIAE